jgi:hypothetical protein
MKWENDNERLVDKDLERLGRKLFQSTIWRNRETTTVYDGIFLFTTASRLARMPTQAPIQWVPGALTPGVKRAVPEADHSSPRGVEIKNVELCLHSPIRLRGVMLS